MTAKKQPQELSNPSFQLQVLHGGSQTIDGIIRGKAHYKCNNCNRKYVLNPHGRDDINYLNDSFKNIWVMNHLQ